MLYPYQQNYGSDARFGNDGSTVLLLHFDGPNAGTTFIDSSKGNHALTANGNAQISAAQFKFGSTSYLGDGTGDYLSLDGSSDFAFGNGDFTIDLWFWATATPNTSLYDQRPTTTEGAYPSIYINSNVLKYLVNTTFVITGATTISTNTWYHCALTRSGTSTKLFLNGVQEGSTYSDSNNYSVGSTRPNIGADGYTPGGASLNGYIDEVRVTKGLARWTANFTPPTAPYGL